MTQLKKQCIRCGTSKPLTEFYKQPKNKDGLQGVCKSCFSADSAKRRRENQERYSAYEASRRDLPHRKAYREECVEKRRKEHPEKHAARKAVYLAIKDGALTKQPCEICGSVGVEAHHHDYSRPLEVRWLCHAHHMEEHRKY